MNVNVANGDRLAAFLIIEGKVYQSDCDHQECLCDYYHDKGIDIEAIDDNWEKLQEELTSKTAAMKEAYDVYGFDLFDSGTDYLLLANDEKTLNDNRAWAEQYASECEAKLGYFISHYDAIVEGGK